MAEHGNKKVLGELSDQEQEHRTHLWIGLGTTLISLLALSLHWWKHTLDLESLRVRREAEQAQVARAAAQHRFWLKEEIKSLKNQQEGLLKKIANESRMIRWGHERGADPTVVEQAEARRRKYQVKLEAVQKKLNRLRQSSNDQTRVKR